MIDACMKIAESSVRVLASSTQFITPTFVQTCDITEEDLIDADCGACGQVQLHIECKEKYCRQQGFI